VAASIRAAALGPPEVTMAYFDIADQPPGTPDTELVAVHQRLSATFAGDVGEAAVERCVTAAISAVRFFGDEPSDNTSLVERMARNELELLREGRNERAWT